ncbi:peptidase inhibitor family I36 protein [Streptomycetaceae bacterium NBC_01309]
MSRKRKSAALALGTAVLGSVILTATPATAASGSCKAGVDVCLYFNSNFEGAKYGLSGTRPHNGLKFGKGNGAGQYVKNNAASVHNMNTYLYVRVTYNSIGSNLGRLGYQTFPPGTKANLNSKMKNENAAQYVYHPGPPPKQLP